MDLNTEPCDETPVPLHQISPSEVESTGDSFQQNMSMENIVGPSDIKQFPNKEMIFADNLLNNFEAVLKYAQEQRKATEEFIFIIKERSARELIYARELDKLCARDFTGFQGSLNVGMLGLKTDFQNRISQSQILAENFLTDIVAPVQDVIKIQADKFKKAIATGRKLDKEMKTLTDKHTLAKAKYQKTCLNAEQLSEQLSNSFEDSPDKRNKMVNRLIGVKKDVDESQKAYLNAIYGLNACKQRFSNQMTITLNDIQAQENERQWLLRDCLRKYVVYQTAHLRHLQYDVEQSAKVMEDVNIQDDLEIWAKAQVSGDISIEPVDFEPFRSNNAQFNALIQNAAPVGRQSEGWMSTMKGLVRQVIPITDQEGDQELEYAWKTAMDDIMELAWCGVMPEAEHFSKFNVMIREPAGRRLWKNFMNVKRTQAEFELSASAFELIGNLLIGVLNEWERKEDAYIAKNAIILSQTFSQEIEEKGQEKEFLVTKIVDHSIWGKIAIWIQIIDQSIREELKNYNSFGMALMSNEDKTRVKNVVFCQLGTYAHILLEFKVSRLATSELIGRYACNYDLSKGDMETLIANIDRFSQNIESTIDDSKEDSQLSLPKADQEQELKKYHNSIQNKIIS